MWQFLNRAIGGNSQRRTTMGTDAYQPLAERMNYPDSEHFRRVLEALMSPQEAEIVALLPTSTRELATKLGLTMETVEQKLEELYQRGVIISTPKGYFFARNPIRLHQATMCDPRQGTDYNRKLCEVWENFYQQEWYKDLASERLTATPRPMRIIPMYPAIKDIPGVQPWEDIREIIREARTLAVVPCVCRRQTGNRCGRAIDVCLNLDEAAEYAINRGTGRRLSPEEALSVVDIAENDGLVHRLFNRRGRYGIVCNCCNDDCVDLLAFIKVGRLHEGDAKSRFEAVVDRDICNGCQICLERCYYDAIQMVELPTDKEPRAAIDPEKCFGCGSCVIKCPQEAISLKLIRPEEHVPAGP